VGIKLIFGLSVELNFFVVVEKRGWKKFLEYGIFLNLLFVKL